MGGARRAMMGRAGVGIPYAEVWNPSEAVKRAARTVMRSTAVFEFVPSHQARAATASDQGVAMRTGDTAAMGMIRSNEAFDDLRHIQNAYDWAPVPTPTPTPASSASRTTKPTSDAPRLPTYQCTFDPLDSFETFVLSLSIKTTRRARLVGDSYPPGNGLESDGVGWQGEEGQTRGWEMSSRVFERRVASGCDRVMRTWFAPPSSPASPSSTSSPGPSAQSSQGELSSSVTKPASPLARSGTPLDSFGVLAATFGASLEDCLPRSQLRLAREQARVPKPPTRTLEIDGSSAVVVVQPYPSAECILRSHPILRAASGWTLASLSSTSSSSSTASPLGAEQAGTADATGPMGGTKTASTGPMPAPTDRGTEAWLFTSPFAYHPSSTRPSPSSLPSTSAAHASQPGSYTTNNTHNSSNNDRDVGTRIDAHFYTTHLRVRAARLLAMIHRLEEDVLEAEEVEARARARAEARREDDVWARGGGGGAEGAGYAQPRDGDGDGDGSSDGSRRFARNDHTVTIWTMNPSFASSGHGTGSGGGRYGRGRGGGGEVLHQLRM